MTVKSSYWIPWKSTNSGQPVQVLMLRSEKCLRSMISSSTQDRMFVSTCMAKCKRCLQREVAILSWLG